MMDFSGVEAGHDSQAPQRTRTRYPSDVAVFPGTPASEEVIDRERKRRALIDLVWRFSVHGLSWTAETTVKISADTAWAAVAFLQTLPGNAALPKIAPDGEGGLTMVWEQGRGESLLLVIDGWRIHLVLAAATPNAEYLDELPFDGEEIPPKVSAAIPRR